VGGPTDYAADEHQRGDNRMLTAGGTAGRKKPTPGRLFRFRAGLRYFASSPA